MEKTGTLQFLTMKLIIVRHGETEENVQKIIQGQLNSPLTQKGIEQTKKVAKRLQGEHIDIAYVSDLDRARETAAEILKFHPNTSVIYTKELRERSWGIWEGKKQEERKIFLDKNEFTFKTYVPQGGESYQALQQRIFSFYNSLLKKHSKQTVLLVSHVGILTALYMTLFQASDAEYNQYHPGNTAVTILEVNDDKKHTVHVLNCVKHLN